MFSGGGSCVSNHLRLRDSDLHRCHQPQLGFGFVFGFGLGTQITGLRVRRSLKSLSARRISSFRSIIHSKSPPDIPTLSHCFRYLITPPSLSTIFVPSQPLLLFILIFLRYI
ncbi:hypothetical protein RchiOBHm_Chr5g0081501 [Rosa chinensis]|uniref:Uncharacterized protein n=1 Tax=Rosa chinensis TaxID=74649 RepID=A0A2P6QN38_ROSCH|nr:hypothetical protein RchiOBHm_Chr5g0081501 [Rosa chinensis]